MTKQTLRAAALAARAALSPEVRQAADAARDLALGDLLRGTRMSAYASFGTEPATSGLITQSTLLPVLRPDRDLDWVARGGGPLLGIDAIASCDIVLVPALAVDRAGHRLGRGAGSYDRALPRVRGLIIALLHEGELVDDLPAEPHDIPVHAVALPAGVVTLRPLTG